VTVTKASKRQHIHQSEQQQQQFKNKMENGMKEDSVRLDDSH